MEKDNGKTRLFGRRFPGSSMVYYFLLLVCVFWLGVYVANVFIGQGLTEKCKQEESPHAVEPKETPSASKKSVQGARLQRIEPVAVKWRKNTFTSRPTQTEPPTEKQFTKDRSKDQKLIVLYGSRVWSKYDAWKDDQWEKCPQPNCHITTNTNMIPKANAVVFNAEAMPPASMVDQFRELREKSRRKYNTKFAFISGITPMETYFNPKSYDKLFDLIITYKSDSDIRIPFWPNNGILPAMLRPKKPGKVLTDDEIGRFKEKNALYFQREGKDSYMVYVIDKCDPTLYENIFAMRFRWEGDISILSHNFCNATKMKFPRIENFPCDDLYSDSCAKFMEGFKFVMIPEKHLCKDHLDRLYWYTLKAWEAVPLLWGSDDIKSQAIPGSYIDVLSKEYVSPSFKDALACNKNGREYSKYMAWKEENRLEEFYWQCELCEKLHSNYITNRTESFGTFWDKEKNCGKKTPLFKLARDQLLRTAAIRP